MLRVDVVEGFHDGPAKLLRDPSGLRGSSLDLRDEPIALRIVVARVDDDSARGCIGEEIAGQLRNVLERDAGDDDLTLTRGVARGDGYRACFAGEVGQGFWAARVRDEHLMAKRAETTGKIAANVSRPDDSDFHDSSGLPRYYSKGRSRGGCRPRTVATWRSRLCGRGK